VKEISAMLVGVLASHETCALKIGGLAEGSVEVFFILDSFLESPSVPHSLDSQNFPWRCICYLISFWIEATIYPFCLQSG